MVGLTDEEKKLPYAKYYYREMAPIPEEKLRVWKGAAADPALATPFEKRNDFLADKVELSIGFTVAEDGTGFVANSTFMPDVTVEMFDWWFGWHSVGSDLRYKLWDRDDHFYARALNPAHVLDPNVPNAQKTWGVTHDILEDIGMGPDPLKLSFMKPSDLGYDMSLIGTSTCSSMVCAVGVSGCPAVMTHKAVAVDGGIWFKSHFWIGYGMVDGRVVCILPAEAAIPIEIPRALFGHNIKEFSNLASFLPQLYAEERENW